MFPVIVRALAAVAYISFSCCWKSEINSQVLRSYLAGSPVPAPQQQQDLHLCTTLELLAQNMES